MGSATSSWVDGAQHAMGEGIEKGSHLNGSEGLKRVLEGTKE